MFQRPPPLNDDALIALKFGGGLEAFQARFGDYYVAGYHLGADAALMLSEGATTSSTVERLSVKVEVTVLFYNDSHTEEKFFTESSANSTFRLSGFDTLSDLHVSETRIGSAGLDSLRKAAGGLSGMANQLANRVSTKMDGLRLQNSDSLGFETCEKLCGSGLVVQLILLPLSTLREVVLWSQSTDII